MSDLDDTIKKIEKKNPSIRKEIDKEKEKLLIGVKIAELRRLRGVTQSELAKSIGTTQSVIARVENANYDRHSIKLLRNIAHACNAELEIEFRVK